ncbi:MAG: hypothetical protein V2J62_02685 [candidate division KSB1 bacterium]|jgi:hypothetical protein|nr:hypothetical protein [candidate division KSB1 bacterium]
MMILPKYTKDEVEKVYHSYRGKLVQRFKYRKTLISHMELVYIPYHIFEMDTEKSKAALQFCVDAIIGSVSVFDPGEAEYSEEINQPVGDVIINRSDAEEAAIQFARDFILQKGMKHKISITMRDIRYQRMIYYPFWIIYLKRSGKLDFLAIDALAGDVQGIQMRRMFLKMFRQTDEDLA